MDVTEIFKKGDLEYDYLVPGLKVTWEHPCGWKITVQADTRQKARKKIIKRIEKRVKQCDQMNSWVRTESIKSLEKLLFCGKLK